jgi:SGNH domain (fused to AT3 domains)
LPARFPSDIQYLVKDFATEANRAYRIRACLLDETQGPSRFSQDCAAAGSGARLVLLWGDSYAAHLFPGLADLQSTTNIGLAQYTASGCPPILGFVSKHRPNCEVINGFVLSRIEALKPHTVILGGRWNLYNGPTGWGTMDRAAVQATIARLAASGVQHIVVVGQFPDWSLAPSHILVREHQLARFIGSASASGPIAEYGADYLDLNAFAVDDTVKQFWSAPNATFIAPRAALCREGGCRLLTPDQPPQPIAWDHGHLTVAGSIYFARANAEQLLGQ